MFRFSLRTLFGAVTLAAVVRYAGYLMAKPHYVVKRFDCGPGQWIELLAPNQFCERGETIRYRFTGMRPAAPRAFDMWKCGKRPAMRLVTAEKGRLVGIASGESHDELHIMVDFKAGRGWPAHGGLIVDEHARDMLNRLRREQGDLWLFQSSDGELTK